MKNVYIKPAIKVYYFDAEVDSVLSSNGYNGSTFEDNEMPIISFDDYND